jgi:hypothetical protein
MRYVTVKQPTQEPVPLSGFTTFNVLAPAVVPGEMVMLAVNVRELTKVVEFTVTPDPNVAFAPTRKCVPSTSTDRVVPLAPVLGAVDAGTGAGLILRHPAHVAERPPVITVTSRVPIGAVAVAFTLVASVLLSTKVVEPTVTPVPDTEAVAPDSKLVPFMIRFRVPPWPTALGFTEAIVGPPLPLTVKMPFPVLF